MNPKWSPKWPLKWTGFGSLKGWTAIRKKINANSHGSDNYLFLGPRTNSIKWINWIIFLIIFSEDPGRGQFIQLNFILSLIVSYPRRRNRTQNGNHNNNTKIDHRQRLRTKGMTTTMAMHEQVPARQCTRKDACTIPVFLTIWLLANSPELRDITIGSAATESNTEGESQQQYQDR